MKKYILLGVIGIFFLSSGCAGFGKKVGRDDNSVKKTQIAGVIAEVKVEATGVKAKKIEATAEITGADLSKKEVIGGDKIVTNDAKMIMYIFGAVMTLMSTIFTGVMGFMGLLIKKMFKQLAEKDKIILDLGNDAKEILLKILPQVDATIHRAYENGLKAIAENKK